MSKAERETVIRWDGEDRNPVMYTADPAQARRWERLGYAVSVTDTSKDGTPRGWTVTGAAGCLRFRRVKDGMVVPRPGRFPIRRGIATRPLRRADDC